jgi:regulator of nonsense transcripts 2
MRSQQQADREEQQRIKNLVLNYEAANEPEVAESKNCHRTENSRFFLDRLLMMKL